MIRGQGETSLARRRTRRAGNRGRLPRSCLRLDVSKSSICVMPLWPAQSAAQTRSRPTPIGAIIPMPVTATRLIRIVLSPEYLYFTQDRIIQVSCRSVHRFEQAPACSSVCGPTAFAQRLCDTAAQHGVCVYALAHQLPEETADQNFVVDDDWNDRGAPSKSRNLSSKARGVASKPSQAAAGALRLALDYPIALITAAAFAGAS